MRRSNRLRILRIALAITAAAMLPATVQARPMPARPDVENHGSYQLGPGEIPYLDQMFRREGFAKTPAVSDDGGTGIDLNAYAVTGLGLALLLVLGLGAGLTIQYYRRANVQPV